MNIKVQTVLANIMSKSGIAIIEKIITGERKAENFLSCIDKRVRAKKDVIKQSLEGNWLPEHRFYWKKIISVTNLCKKEF
ncbi:MAG: hypothetical protein ACR2FN_15145 [Chitinophagaceae bacterium]